MTQTTFHNLLSTITPQPTDTRISHDSQKCVTTLRFTHPTPPSPNPDPKPPKSTATANGSSCNVLKMRIYPQIFNTDSTKKDYPYLNHLQDPIIHESLNFLWTAMAHTFISETDKLSPHKNNSLLNWSSYKNLRLYDFKLTSDPQKPTNQNQTTEKVLKDFLKRRTTWRSSSSTEVRASTPSLRSPSSSVGNIFSSMTWRIAEYSSTSPCFIVHRVVPIRRTHVHIVFYYVPGFQCTFWERTFGVPS